MSLILFKVLTLKGFTSRPQLWPGLAKLLNEVIYQAFLKCKQSKSAFYKVTPLVADWQVGGLERYPLPEDWDLQAFSPLATALQPLDMRLVGR